MSEKVDLEDLLNVDEFHLAESMDSEIHRNGFDMYVVKVKRKVYPVAEAVAKFSPNELLVFEDALAKFRAVRDGSTQTH